MVRLLAALTLCGIVASGCGKGGNPGPTPPPPVTIVPSADPAPGPATGPTPTPSPTAPAAANEPSKPKSKIDSSVPEDKVFLVNAEVNNFDVADPAVSPEDEFLVATTADTVRDMIVSGGTIAGTITAKLPTGFSPLPEWGATAEGWPRRIRCAADGADMAYIPGGVFRQGVDGGPADTGPAHPVYLDPYYMDVDETTLQRYFQCKNVVKEDGKAPMAEPANSSQPQDHPAIGIQWRDAVAYAKWAKKELPTEAEWELAGRSNKSYEYPWGNDRAIWERSRRPGQIEAIGSFRGDVSPYGVRDLAGNAREWCSDLFLPDYYAGAKERDGSPIRNPQGPRSGLTATLRVAKGSKTGWELWARTADAMQKTAPDLGFRCVLRLTPEAPPKETPAKK